MAIHNALTKMLSIRVPIILAPMAGASGGLLAASVHKSGGFGFIAGGASPLASLRSEIALARTSLALSPSDPLPLGIGLMLWRLQAPHGDASLLSPFLDTVLSERPKAIWLAFGTGIGEVVQEIRRRESKSENRKIVIMVMVGTVNDGIEASQWDVEIIVGQGIESGGHGPKDGPGLPLISLLPLLSKHLATLPPSSRPLLLAAGGIYTGLQLLSTLPFTSGAVLGTTFLATPESLYSAAQKVLILKSSGEETVRSVRWDIGRNTLEGWGEEVDGRGVGNLTSENVEEGEEECRKLYGEAMKAGDLGRTVTWAGTSVGLITKVESVEEIITRIEKECLEGIAAIKKLSE